MDQTMTDVLKDSSPSSAGATASQLPQAPVVAQVTENPGGKTPPDNLLKALQEERRLRKEAEDRERALQDEINRTTTTQSTDVYSDEGQALKTEIDSLRGEFISLREEKILDGLYAQHPALKDKKAEFDEFRKDYPRNKLENVAKLFLSEIGVLSGDQPRKGLENPTGGVKAAQTTVITADDVKKLRENNYKEYLKMLREGKLNDIQ